jgi:photosystem II stability/assembly factor-like uncharacterized protein
MKTLFTLFIVVAISFNSYAQPWLNNLPKARKGNYTLTDYQNAFNQYWKGKHVKGGYYYKNGIKTKALGWKQFKRWENYWKTRANVDGSFPTKAQYQNAKQSYEANLTRATTAAWTNLGPDENNDDGGGVGRINHVAFHPSDANTFWVATPNGGVWKTTDGGNSWTVLTDKNDVLTTSVVAIPSDYATSKTIYIGTGERDAWSHDNGIGVLKSTDGGATWKQTGLSFDLSDDISVNDLLIDPNNNNVLYAATTKGLYKSTNGGDSWSEISTQDYDIVDIEFKPGDASILYAGYRYGAIFKYTGSGANQSVVYSDYNNGARRVELAVSPDEPTWVYAVVTDSYADGLHAFLKSTNSGDDFSEINDTNILGYLVDEYNDVAGQGSYDLAMAVNPDDANDIYVGGINTWRSTDGGLTWHINNYWSSYYCDTCKIVHADQHYLTYHNGIVYECNDGGMFKTENDTDWTRISNGIINSQMYRLGVAQTTDQVTMTGLQDNGTKIWYYSTWYQQGGGDGMECIIDYTNLDIRYSSIYYGDISRLKDGAWTTISDTAKTGVGAWTTPYIINPKNPKSLYFGYADVWKTEDYGDSIRKISDINSSQLLQSMAIAPSDTNTLYVADYQDMWRTTDGGANWTKLSGLPTTSSFITYIAVKNDDPNTVWVTFGQFNKYCVYQSTDGGNNWTDISSGIPPIPVNTIIQDTMNTDEVILYAGTEYGVYMKRGNANWTLYNDGMPKVVIDELDMYYSPSSHAECRLRAATYGRGLWETEPFFVKSDSSFDIDIVNIYAPGEFPRKAGQPFGLTVEVGNHGPDVADSVELMVDIKGANPRYLDTVITKIDSGVAVLITFDSLTVSNLGYDTITAFVHNGGGDSYNLNNSKTHYQIINDDTSYAWPWTDSSEVQQWIGLADHLFSAKFYIQNRPKITSVDVFIKDTNSIGHEIKSVLLSDTRTVLDSSDHHTITAEDINHWVNLPFNDGGYTADMDFVYAGMHQIGDGYIPLGTNGKDPGYQDVFFMSNPDGTSMYGPYTNYGSWFIRMNLHLDPTTTTVVYPEEKHFMVMPNPTTGQFKVVLNDNTKGSVKVSIMNMTGQIVLQKTTSPFDKNINLDLSQFSNGTYHVQITTEDGSIMHQLLILNK